MPSSWSSEPLLSSHSGVRRLKLCSAERGVEEVVVPSPRGTPAPLSGDITGCAGERAVTVRPCGGAAAVERRRGPAGGAAAVATRAGAGPALVLTATATRDLDGASVVVSVGALAMRWTIGAREGDTAGRSPSGDLSNLAARNCGGCGEVRPGPGEGERLSFAPCGRTGTSAGASCAPRRPAVATPVAVCTTAVGRSPPRSAGEARGAPVATAPVLLAPQATVATATRARGAAAEPGDCAR
mmetsp:Transcript_55172/g.118542  ORF Transcript_55172/g.118542 Transcript_55172/m.118542 type:complete len:241 (+) Transcript_55172:632-1354(+)